MKTLLVTGAYGLVGSAICKAIESHSELDIALTKIKGRELHTLDNQVYNYIIHAAGYGQPQKFSNEKIETIKINTVDLMELIRLRLKADGKLLYVSTSEVYSGAKSPYKETDIGITTPQHPRACYIEGKRCGEAICMAYKEQGYDVKIARLALAYGPGTKKGDTRVINQFIEQALTTGKIQMKDDGQAVRTYCYIDDVVNQLLNILFNGKEVVYNVGGFSTWSIANLASHIGNMLNVEVIRGEHSLEGAPEDVRLDMAKTLKEFPIDFVGIDEGLLKTINYQKELYGIK